MDNNILRKMLLFFTAFIGSYGVMWGFIESYSYFELKWFDNVPIKEIIAICLLVLSFASGLIFLNIGSVLKNRNIKDNKKSSFDQSLVETLSSAVKNRNYVEAIRIGAALNRPLFESGNFETRLKIGRIVEEAAALSNRKVAQVEALIDAIGWSLVELGEYAEAKRIIFHGITICQEIENEFYMAKGYRHLGVISRRMENFPEAENYYQLSMTHITKVEDRVDKDVLIAGLNYALATLYFYKNDFEKSSFYIDKAILSFSQLSDEYRYHMSLVTKGDIEFKKGKNDDAKDIYRNVLRKADSNTEKLQVVRSILGLGEVYLSEHQWPKVEECIKNARDIDLKDFKAESIRLDKMIAALSR